MAVDGGDENLQAYGYAGALHDRKESLQDEMARQMQQMALQQQLLQQQLTLVAGNSSIESSNYTAAQNAAGPPASAKEKGNPS